MILASVDVVVEDYAKFGTAEVIATGSATTVPVIR